jgi:hypothetical protein
MRLSLHERRDGYWLLLNAADGDMKVTKADGNFGLRLPGCCPR